MKKSLSYILAICALLGAGAVYACNGNYPAMAEEFAERFNLNVEEVKQFMEEKMAQRQEQMEGRFEEMLDKKIEESNLTEEQKTLILEKREEMKQKMDEMKDLTPEERREAMEQYREELKTWAEENGIDLGLLMGHQGFGPRAPHAGWGLGKIKENK